MAAVQKRSWKNSLMSFVSKARFAFLSSKKRIAITSVVSITIIFLVWKFFGQTSAQISYQTAQVTKGSIIASISESGNVATNNQVTVTSPTDGIITAVYVKNGDSVNAGQNLFSVKSTATPQQQTQAYANYLAAQNTLNSAKSNLNSLQEALFKANQAFVTDKGTANPDTSDPVYIEEQAAWQQAEANYTNQQGVINQAEAALNNAAIEYDATQDTIVTAPTSGTVANLSATQGSTVSSGNSNSSNSSTSTTSSTPVLILGNFSQLVIKVAVNEVDISKIHTGQKATVTLDALNGKTFVGTVTSIDTIGTNNSGVITYNVYISLLNPPQDIKPGMSATAVIQTQRQDDTLYVPTSAIQTNNGISVVQVMKNGKPIQQEVTTGIASDTDTQITSGLSEGDTVVTNTFSLNRTTQTSSPFSGNSFGGRGFTGGFGGNRAIIKTGGQ